jgi:hypothetical protein
MSSRPTFSAGRVRLPIVPPGSEPSQSPVQGSPSDPTRLLGTHHGGYRAVGVRTGEEIVVLDRTHAAYERLLAQRRPKAQQGDGPDRLELPCSPRGILRRRVTPRRSAVREET